MQNLNIDGQQFHQYQHNEQSHLTNINITNNHIVIVRYVDIGEM
jgi:hypothetical protein